MIENSHYSKSKERETVSDFESSFLMLLTDGLKWCSVGGTGAEAAYLYSYTD